MGMDVWAVKTEHIDSPKGSVREFLFDLAGEDLPEGWIGGWDGNVFLQILREDLERRARDYTSEQCLSQTDADKLLSWVEALPWERDDITLHLGW